MIESKFNTPSKFTGEMMGTKVAVEYNHSTIDFDEVIDAFNTILTGLGYHPDAIKEWIVDRAAEYNKEDAQSENNEWDVTLQDGLEDEGDYFWEENATNKPAFYELLHLIGLLCCLPQCQPHLKTQNICLMHVDNIYYYIYIYTQTHD
jgi:hypothetical protein